MEWKSCKNILVIRPDNMGDVLMSAPAIRALQESFQCNITLLTSSLSLEAAALLPWIKEVMCYDLPWIKTNNTLPCAAFEDIIAQIRSRAFDGCVLFNVSSQNPAPSVMIAFMAGIPLRAAYCRENLYGLLTHWLPDPEPYFEISHQVVRDLKLCSFIGAHTAEKRIRISINEEETEGVLKKLGMKKNDFFIFHIGVSEKKRAFPKKDWIKLGKLVVAKYGLRVLLSGNSRESGSVERISAAIGKDAIPIAGLLSLKELASCIAMARAMVSVNTGPMHLAAAVGTPILALYARTNPQHGPWMVPYKMIEFDVPLSLQSSNQVLRFQTEKAYPLPTTAPDPQTLLDALDDLLNETAIV